MESSIKKFWNDGSDEYYNRAYNINNNAIRIKADPWWAFPVPVRNMIQNAFGSMKGIKVLVPSSGDNGAVFAFHLLGATVVSADISEQQLGNAKKIADNERWNIEFIQADTMKLDGMCDSEFDLVYTSNGTHIWINDLQAMYSNFNRVLKPKGKYIMFETHPFNRPFDDSGAKIKVKKPYNDTTGNHWRIMDIFNAVISQGFYILHLEEFHAEPGAHDLWFYKTIKEAEADGNRKYDIKHNPFAALPAWFGLSSIKRY